MSRRVLCVDDEPSVLSALKRTLAGRVEVEVATRPDEALRLLEERGPFGVVLSDMRMPGMDGTRLLEEVKRRAPDTVRIVLTGETDQHTAASAVNRGQIFRFLNKPCPREELLAALEAGLAQYRLVRAERELLEHTVSGAVRVMTDILALVDPASVGRAGVLKERVVELARDLGVDSTWEFEVACLLSRLGRVTIPQEIRDREREGRPLRPEERAVLARVPEVGWRLLRNVPRLEAVAAGVRWQEARYDGAGSLAAWPRGDDLPLVARALKVAADLDALRRAGLGEREAVDRLERDAGAYDPRCLAALAARHRLRASAPRPEAREIPFADLRPGHVLGAPIETLDGRRVLAEGHVVTRVVLERLRNHHSTTGIREPLVVTGRAEVAPEEEDEAPPRRRTA